MYSYFKKATLFALSILAAATRVSAEDANLNVGVNIVTAPHGENLELVEGLSGDAFGVGGGTVTLNAPNNTYTGPTYLFSGTLSLADPTFLPNALQPVVFSPGVLSSTTSTLQFTAPFAFQNKLIIGNNFTAVIDVDGNPISLYSVITDLTSVGNLTIGGGNILTLYGKATHSGSTLIDVGTTFQAGDAGLFSSSSPIEVEGALDLNNYDQTIGALSGNGDVNLGIATLTLNGPDAASTFSGVISGEGNLNLEVGGLTLSNVNTYAGTTTIGTNGTLRAGIDNPISSSSHLKVDGLLALNDGIGNDFDMTVNGLSGIGSINLGATGVKTLTVLGDAKNAFAGTISGDGNLTVGSITSTPTLQLTGPNTYSGNTAIWGTLESESTAALSSAANYEVKVGGTLDLKGHNSTINALKGGGSVLTEGAALTVKEGSFSGNISGNGPLIKETAGTLTLSGNNSLSSVTIEEGILEISAPSSIGTGNLSFGSESTGAKGSQISFLGTNQVFTHPISIAEGFTATFSGHQIRLEGDLSDETTGGNVTFSGAFTLSGDNTYSGATVVEDASTLNAGSTTALSADSPFNVKGTLALSDGTIDYSNCIKSLTGDGTVVLGVTNSPDYPLLTIVNGNGETFSGNLTSSGSIELQSGQLTLAGNGNTFSGNTRIESGATLVAAVSHALSQNSAIAMEGTLNTGETGNTVPSISGNGNVTLGSTGAGSLTLTAPTRFDGNISGAGSLTFKSGGMDLLTGHNTYSGSTTISGGTLSAGSRTAFSPSSDFIVDGTLALVSYDNTIGSLRGGGTVDLGSTGTVLTIANGKGLTFTGHLKEGGGIELQSNTLILAPTGRNDYTGPTTIGNGATLAAGATNAFSENSPFNVNGVLSLNNGSSDFSANVQSISGSNSHAIIDLGSIGGAVLTIDGDGLCSFPGSIKGQGGLKIGPTTSFILNGKSDYAGPTAVDGELTTTLTGGFSPNSAFTVDGTLTVNDKNNALLSLSGTGLVDLGVASNTVLTVGGGDFAGHIIGAGQVHVDTSGVFTLEADNSYSGGTTISAGTLALKNGGALLATGNLMILPGGIFDISQITTDSQTIANLSGGDLTSSINLGDRKLILGTNRSTTYGGTIQGAGGLVKQGAGSFTLTGIATNSGGVEVKSGTLIGNSGNLQSVVQVDSAANLTFDQTGKGIFSGTLMGSGKVFKTGLGTLSYNHHSSNVAGFTGLTIVSEGTVALNTVLGGNMIVQKQGTLSGHGTLRESLYLNSGATIAPSHSFGKITILGNYIQCSDTTYLVQIDKTGNSSLIDVFGKATLKGGEVMVTSKDGKVLINHRYDIFHAEGGVFNTFAGVTIPGLRSNSLLYSPKLIYGSHDIFLELATTFIHAAHNANQKQVALQLDSIVNPDPSQAALLSHLASLPVAQASIILEQLTGQQQTADLFAAELINRDFLRRLYDPIRSLVTTLPCMHAPSPCGWTAWIEGGGGRYSLDNSSEAFGFKMNGGEVTLGIQNSLSECLAIGAAVCYAHDQIDYKQGGNGRMNNSLAGIYALYRPNNFYLLTDIVYGYSHNKISRQVILPALPLDIISHPELNQFTLYGEGGIDLPCGHLLFQPYAAFEVGGVWRNGSHETGGGDFDLDIEKREEGTAFSRLGLHATTSKWPFGMIVSLDAAWQCRLTRHQNCIWETFSNFGSSFNVQGVTVDRNCFQGAVTLSLPVNRSVTLFAEGGGEAWRNASHYAFTFGLTASW